MAETAETTADGGGRSGGRRAPLHVINADQSQQAMQTEGWDGEEEDLPRRQHNLRTGTRTVGWQSAKGKGPSLSRLAPHTSYSRRQKVRSSAGTGGRKPRWMHAQLRPQATQDEQEMQSEAAEGQQQAPRQKQSFNLHLPTSNTPAATSLSSSSTAAAKKKKKKKKTLKGGGRDRRALNVSWSMPLSAIRTIPSNNNNASSSSSSSRSRIKRGNNNNLLSASRRRGSLASPAATPSAAAKLPSATAILPKVARAAVQASAKRKRARAQATVSAAALDNSTDIAADLAADGSPSENGKRFLPLPLELDSVRTPPPVLHPASASASVGAFNTFELNSSGSYSSTIPSSPSVSGAAPVPSIQELALEEDCAGSPLQSEDEDHQNDDCHSNGSSSSSSSSNHHQQHNGGEIFSKCNICTDSNVFFATEAEEIVHDLEVHQRSKLPAAATSTPFSKKPAAIGVQPPKSPADRKRQRRDPKVKTAAIAGNAVVAASFASAPSTPTSPTLFSASSEGDEEETDADVDAPDSTAWANASVRRQSGASQAEFAKPADSPPTKMNSKAAASSSTPTVFNKKASNTFGNSNVYELYDVDAFDFDDAAVDDEIKATVSSPPPSSNVPATLPSPSASSSPPPTKEHRLRKRKKINTPVTGAAILASSAGAATAQSPRSRAAAGMSASALKKPPVSASSLAINANAKNDSNNASFITVPWCPPAAIGLNSPTCDLIVAADAPPHTARTPTTMLQHRKSNAHGSSPAVFSTADLQKTPQCLLTVSALHC